MKILFSLAWPALLVFFCLAGLAYLLDFNGLYGQDAHEYLRQSLAIADRLRGMLAAPAGMGDAEMAGGYPLAGALLQLLGLPPLPAMQAVSWLGAAAAFWLFELNLRLLAPGARAESRWVFGALALALAPVFVRSGLTVMSDTPGLALALAALFFCLRAIERQRPGDVLLFVVLSAWTITTRYALVALLAVPALALALEWWRARRRGWLIAAVLTGLLALYPLWWLKAGAPKSPLTHSLLLDWSPAHFFAATFTQTSGTVSYTLPNILYLFYPLMHPGFCLVLPGLFLLAKRTDATLYIRRLLLFSLAVYLLFLGGLMHQNLRYLLPAYAVLLLLFFPAWDRFFAYGLYFFKRLACALMGLALFFQVFFSIRMLLPVLERHRLEREVATALRIELPARADLYAFDLDIALQSYLPGVALHNLWVQRYDTFPPGSYVLFNAPKLQTQWAGKNPMLNWEHLRLHYNLTEIKRLPEGWTLYRVEPPG